MHVDEIALIDLDAIAVNHGGGKRLLVGIARQMENGDTGMAEACADGAVPKRMILGVTPAIRAIAGGMGHSRAMHIAPIRVEFRHRHARPRREEGNLLSQRRPGHDPVAPA